MITSWQIWDFKSFGSTTEPLALPPVTILVGANSSGKSSIIQTILLIKQTFQYGGQERPVLLNGPLLRLGNFYDVKNALSPSRGFRLSFSIILNEPSDTEAATTWKLAVGKKPQVFSVSSDVTYGLDAGKSADEISLLQPFLRQSITTIYSRDGNEVDFQNIWVKRARRHHVEGRLQDNIKSKKDLQLTDLRVHNLSLGLAQELSEKRPGVKIHGAYHRYMIADRFLVSFDQAKQQSISVGEQFTNPYVTLLGNTWGEPVSAELLVIIKKEVLDWLSEMEADVEYSDAVNRSSSLAEVLRAIHALITTKRRATSGELGRTTTGLLQMPDITTDLNDAGTALRSRVEARVRAEIGDEPGLDIVRPPLLSTAAQSLQDYFTKKVRYLGPLRESPKPLYPLEALSDPTDVGYRGEHTAAVLDLNKRKVIWFVAPPDESGKFPEQTRASLQTAVVLWLQYMDLVADVATGDRGKFGRELQVALPDVPKLHDLTNVGVGVSQVLPIIVLALLAPDDCTLILEQPELHLHPRVQSRLGDFLLSLSSLRKQTIIETHSEHLIYRLRRRVAESDSDIGEAIGLYYVERLKGESKVRRVDINKFGALSEWPKGFFDQSQLEAEQIIKAAAQKHSQRKFLSDGRSSNN